MIRVPHRPVGLLPTYRWLQFGLGALGLLVLAVWAVVWLGRSRPAPDPSTQLSSTQRTTAWLLILGVFLAACAVMGLSVIRDGLSTESVAVRVATGMMSLDHGGGCRILPALARRRPAPSVHGGESLARSAGQGPADGAQRGAGERPGDQPVGGRQGGQQQHRPGPRRQQRDRPGGQQRIAQLLRSAQRRVLEQQLRRLLRRRREFQLRPVVGQQTVDVGHGLRRVDHPELFGDET